MLASAGKQSNPTDWPGFAKNGQSSLRKRILRGTGTLALILAAGGAPGFAHAADLETPRIRFQISPDTGRYEVLDKQANVIWRSNPFQERFGEVTLTVSGKTQRTSLGRCEVKQAPARLELIFQPLSDQPNAKLRVHIRALADEKTLEFSYEADPALSMDGIRLLDDALWVTDATAGYVVVPVRMGLLIPANSGLKFTHRFDTFGYEGCHMEMLGIVKDHAAVLLTWRDPYVAAEVRSAVTNAAWLKGKQVLSPSLALRKSARTFRVQFLGPGDYGTIAQAYRQVARDKGWLVTWDEKLKGHPERAKLFGAINYKLWSVLSRRLSEDSQKEISARVNWTFDEAAQIAEHLKHDLKLDKVLFLMGGWIHRGYDNQHPDILPTAPECGGDAAFADCARRVMRLGYVFGLHDNYQDIYRDSPSWDETLVNKNPDGTLTRGGQWAGGRAYITCAQKAVELAKRPQNLPAVKKLCGANAYFIDTTYAAGLYECFDPKHPMTRADDLKWKQAISDYAREVFGIFGSECGREWGIPHSDFFEGLTGVSGRYYHNAALPANLGAVVVPLFELVYRDCLALYGKYGYDYSQAAEYVLHHISIGRPMHYHSIPSHLYWKTESGAGPEMVAVQPAVAELKQTATRRFSVSYRWLVEKSPARDWRVFVHFTDAAGNIKFQNDHDPKVPTSKWPVGEIAEGPFTVAVPDDVKGTFEIRMGLFEPPLGQRAALPTARDGEHRALVGKVQIVADRIEFEPVKEPSARLTADAALFTRADNGWADGLHPLDRFVKNTYEVLSPLHELTARMLMTHHQFLTEDRQVQRTVFGAGPNAVEVIVNAGRTEHRHDSKLGGKVVLPPYGFLVEAPTFVAFHARQWNGVDYDAPTLFTLRSVDGQPLGRASKMRVYHGFGDAKIKIGHAIHSVSREAVVP